MTSPNSTRNDNVILGGVVAAVANDIVDFGALAFSHHAASATRAPPTPPPLVLNVLALLHEEMIVATARRNVAANQMVMPHQVDDVASKSKQPRTFPHALKRVPGPEKSLRSDFFDDKGGANDADEFVLIRLCDFRPLKRTFFSSLQLEDDIKTIRLTPMLNGQVAVNCSSKVLTIDSSLEPVRTTEVKCNLARHEIKQLPVTSMGKNFTLSPQRYRSMNSHVDFATVDRAVQKNPEVLITTQHPVVLQLLDHRGRVECNVSEFGESLGRKGKDRLMTSRAKNHNAEEEEGTPPMLLPMGFVTALDNRLAGFPFAESKFQQAAASQRQTPQHQPLISHRQLGAVIVGLREYDVQQSFALLHSWDDGESNSGDSLIEALAFLSVDDARPLREPVKLKIPRQEERFSRHQYHPEFVTPPWCPIGACLVTSHDRSHLDFFSLDTGACISGVDLTISRDTRGMWDSMFGFCVAAVAGASQLLVLHSGELRFVSLLKLSNWVWACHKSWTEDSIHVVSAQNLLAPGEMPSSRLDATVLGQLWRICPISPMPCSLLWYALDM